MRSPSIHEVADEVTARYAAPDGDRFSSAADVEALGLSALARSLLRWGGYEEHHDATDELVDAGLIRWALEMRPPCYVLTPDGGDAFVLIGGGT